MKTITNITYPAFALFAFVCFALSPQARAVCQDACLTNDNTVQGDDALINLTTGVAGNTAIGSNALSNNVSGANNTATGSYAMWGDYNFGSTGSNNTATGSQALVGNSNGSNNTASGASALHGNVSGNYNTATGQGSLYSNDGSNNTADGQNALKSNTTGSNNVAVGSNAGKNLTTGNNNIDVSNPGVAGEANTIRIGKQGTQTATFIAGVYNANEGGTIKPVYVNSNGRLGTQAPASSQRFKTNVKPMGSASEAILGLKPVTFHYKSDSESTPHFGLIAEQVEKVNPDLVVRDEHGEIYTVRYEAVNAMLLNEFLKEHQQFEEQKAGLAEMKSVVSKQEELIAKQQKQIETLTATVRKVSERIELSAPAVQIAVNDE